MNRALPIISFLVCSLALNLASDSQEIAASVATRKAQMETERMQILQQAEALGGWETWKRSLSPYRTELKAVLKEMNAHEDTRIRDFDGHLMAAFDISYVLADSFLVMNPPVAEPPKHFAVIVDFHEQLKKKGIDLIFVPVPTNTELIPGVLASHAPAPGISNAPQRPEFLLALMDKGVEVIDLYPGLYREQQRTGETLSLKDDSHWDQLGIIEGARQVAERLKRYDFVQASKQYQTKIIEVERRGNLTRDLPETAQVNYPATTWTLQQVLDETGAFYEDDPESPILVAGDSFTYLFADDHAGVSAHIAKEIGTPIARMSNPRGGPNVPRTLARQGKEFIDKRRVVVWIMSARYLLTTRVDDWQGAPLP